MIIANRLSRRGRGGGAMISDIGRPADVSMLLSRDGEQSGGRAQARGELSMFVIRATYPGGHSVWLTRRFPSVAWGPEKDALSFPTETDAARTAARLRASGPVTVEPIQ